MDVCVIDTNIFLRLLLKDNVEQHNQVKRLFQRAKLGKIKITIIQIVIFEVLFILDSYYNLSKSEIIQKLKIIVSTPYVEIEDRSTFIQALKLYKSYTLSFVDCFLLAKALEGEKRLMTFDKKLEKAYRELIEH